MVTRVLFMGEGDRDIKLTTDLHLVLRLRKVGYIILPPPIHLRVCRGTNFTFVVTITHKAANGQKCDTTYLDVCAQSY